MFETLRESSYWALFLIIGLSSEDLYLSSHYES